MSDVVSEGTRLIDRWRKSQEQLDRAKSAVTKAECEVSNAQNELGKWLTPADAKNGEQFCVWHGDSLITATKDQSNYKVEIRKRGKSLMV
jgi:hypothetical protein